MYFHVMITISVQMAIDGVGQPVGGECAEAEPLEQPVERAVGLEHEAPADADDDLGDHVGNEDQDADHRLEAHLAVQQQGEAEGDRALHHERHDRDEHVVTECLVERGIGEDDDVVAQPDEVDGGSVARPAEEAVVRRQHDREDHEGDEDDQRGPDEDREFEAGCPPAPGTADRRSRPPAADPTGAASERCPHRRSGVPGASAVVCEVSRTEAISFSPQDFAAASLTASTMACASPWPANMSTTATLSALPMFWP